MANVFVTLEQQLGNVTAEITVNTSKIQTLSGPEKQKTVRHVEKLIEECKELLEQMELEVRQLASTERGKYQTRLRSYQTEMARLEKDLRQANVMYRDDNRAREELLGDDESEDQKTRLLDNTERLERSSHKLETGYRMVVETEQMGAEILGNLQSQRETIHRARDRLRDTDEDLGKSSRILSAMVRRILQNRVILYAIGGVILIVIVVTIYLTASR